MSEEDAWVGRLDRLLAGNLSEQLGSALQAMAAQVAEIAQRARQIDAVREELTRIAEGLRPDPLLRQIAEQVTAVERQIAEGPGAVVEASARAWEEQAALLRAAIERVEGELARLAETVSNATAGGEAVGELSARLAGLEQRLGSTSEALSEGLREGREQGLASLDAAVARTDDAIGRLRGRLLSSLQSLSETVATLDPSERLVGLERQAAALEMLVSERTDALGRELAAALGSVGGRLDESLRGRVDEAARQMKGLTDLRAETTGALEALRLELGARSESAEAAVDAAAARAVERVGEELAGVTDRLGDRLGELDRKLQALAGLEQMAAMLRRQAPAIERGFEALGAQTAASGARSAAMLEALAGRIGALERRLEALAERTTTELREAGKAAGRQAKDARSAVVEETSAIGDRLFERIVQATKELTELLATVSASSGAIHFRVRGAEAELARIRTASERALPATEERLAEILERLDGLADGLKATEERIAELARERDLT